MPRAEDAERAGSGAPTVVIATGWTRGILPMGLDRPLSLGGGDRLGADGLGATLPLDHLPELMALVGEECAAREAGGTRWFGLPPLALVGSRGSGRTHAARQLARHAGLPFLRLDLAGEEGLRRLRRSVAPSEVEVPSEVVLAMLASGRANPVVLVTGLDEADGETLATLASMVDRRAGRRWTEEGVSATVDLTHVTWLIAVEDVSGLPQALRAALRPIDVALPARASGEGVTTEQELMTLGLLDELLADLGRPGLVRPDAYRTVLGVVAKSWTWRSLADLRLMLASVLTAAGP